MTSFYNLFQSIKCYFQDVVGYKVLNAMKCITPEFRLFLYRRYSVLYSQFVIDFSQSESKSPRERKKKKQF